VLEQAKQAAEILSAQSADKPKSRGQQPKHGVARSYIADTIGVSETALRKAEQHVETAEEFPFMKAGTWRQSHVLAVREQIEKLPEPERGKAADVLGCAKLMDPALAIDLVRKLANKEAYGAGRSLQAEPQPDPRQFTGHFAALPLMERPKSRGRCCQLNLL
jgi:hypothetical protein